MTWFGWIGGINDGVNWTWSDGKVWEWNVNNLYLPNTKMKGKRCLTLYGDLYSGHLARGLMDSRCSESWPFICEYPGMTKIKSDSHLVFTSKNSSMSALQFKLKQTAGTDKRRSREKWMANTTRGFRLNWTLVKKGTGSC